MQVRNHLPPPPHRSIHSMVACGFFSTCLRCGFVISSSSFFVRRCLGRTNPGFRDSSTASRRQWSGAVHERILRFQILLSANPASHRTQNNVHALLSPLGYEESQLHALNPRLFDSPRYRFAWSMSHCPVLLMFYHPIPLPLKFPVVFQANSFVSVPRI
jgi:hypothetical protein